MADTLTTLKTRRSFPQKSAIVYVLLQILLLRIERMVLQYFYCPYNIVNSRASILGVSSRGCTCRCLLLSLQYAVHRPLLQSSFRCGKNPLSTNPWRRLPNSRAR